MIYPSDVGSVALDAEASQNEPKLRRAESPADRETPVAVVDDGAWWRLVGRRCRTGRGW
jgi:hypothetical protein